MLLPFLDALAASEPARLLRASATAYLVINAAHILSIGLIVGAILPLDLRLAGALRAVPLRVIAPFLSRVAATGVACAVVTGLALFSVRPAEYASNSAFLAKIGLAALGLANAAAIRFGGDWSRVLAGGPVSVRLRIHAILSLVVWVAAVLAGRWIGFL
ncbi:DUF2214 domain-containing protein [Ensifer soli]|uniref:DUF2214 domain-containing protein n=1 Tax=Ciceribacter sp. sgz301302 TaxID=3342379 RepID=UPI0035B7560E